MSNTLAPRPTGAVRALAVAALVALPALVAAAPALATFPGDNGRIAYTADPEAAAGVETVAADGSDRTPYPGAAGGRDPAWSPDGTRIAFSRDDAIWVARGDGSEAEQLTAGDPGNDRRPTWSPDGTRIAFVRGPADDTRLFVMGADGKNEVAITDEGDAAGPEWSPDGSRIAFTSDAGGSDALWTVRPDGTERTEVAAPAAGAYDPSWSPDGARIVFHGCPVQCRLFVVAAQGGAPEAITPADRAIGWPAWSPDGTKIAAVEDAGDIVAVAPDGSHLTTLVGDGVARERLRWQSIPRAPAATTGAATNVTTTAATLTGTVNPSTRAFDTTYRFEYGPTPEYGRTTDERTVPGGTEDRAVAAELSGLEPGTLYHFRLVATNASGTTTGADRTFTTGGGPAAPPCPAGTVGTPPDCAPVVTKHPAKLSLLRATIDRRAQTISIFAPISARASGRVRIRLHAAGRFTRFTAPVDAQRGWVRIVRSIPAAQARLGTGILTIRYAGDADTRPQVVRSRAANRRAQLTVVRPQIVGDRLQASGTVSPLARGVVRVQLQYQVGNDTITVRRRARIRVGGRWGLNSRLATARMEEMGRRVGTVHSYTQFTGYLPRRVRGEQRSLEVLGDR